MSRWLDWNRRKPDEAQRWIEAAKPELFVLQDDLVAAVNSDEMSTTVRDLKELALWHPPYDKLCIDMSAAAYVLRHHSPDETLQLLRDAGVERIRCLYEWRHDLGDAFSVILTHVKDGMHHELDAEFEDGSDGRVIAVWMLNLLIVSLAVRNVVKSVRSTGTNVSRKNATRCFLNYTTVLLPPASERENDPDHPAIGGHVSPHMRRGHIRRQHHGPNRSLIKQVWIAPIFVNADPNYVQQRQRYIV